MKFLFEVLDNIHCRQLIKYTVSSTTHASRISVSSCHFIIHSFIHLQMKNLLIWHNLRTSLLHWLHFITSCTHFCMLRLTLSFNITSNLTSQNLAAFLILFPRKLLVMQFPKISQEPSLNVLYYAGPLKSISDYSLCNFGSLSLGQKKPQFVVEFTMDHIACFLVAEAHL